MPANIVWLVVGVLVLIGVVLTLAVPGLALLVLGVVAIALVWAIIAGLDTAARRGSDALTGDDDEGDTPRHRSPG